MRQKREWPKTTEEIWLLLRVIGLLTALRLLLPYTKMKTLLKWLSPSRIPSIADAHRLEQTVRYTDALLRRLRVTLPAGKCIPRSLTLYYFVTRCGLPVHFHCGVRRLGERLQGHAWLSLHGNPFLERGNSNGGFAVTFSFPTSEASDSKRHSALTAEAGVN